MKADYPDIPTYSQSDHNLASSVPQLFLLGTDFSFARLLVPIVGADQSAQIF
jgi:hypothetical protein